MDTTKQSAGSPESGELGLHAQRSSWWFLTCPSNLGTGLRAGTMVKLPLLSERKDFKAVCGKLKLQARGTGGVDSASSGGI